MRKVSLAFSLASSLLAASVFASDSVQFTIVPFHSIAFVTPTSMVPTICEHSDGTYTNVHVTGVGPVTSNDPRMEGIFHVNAMILTNAQGIGVSRDEWSITDPVTGAIKVAGVAEALDADQTGPIHSVVTARLSDGSYMSTMAVVTLPQGPNQPITVEYGGAVPPDPGRGVIISRDCGGYFKADRQGYKSLFDENEDD